MAKYIDKDALVAEIRKRLLPVIRDKHYNEWEKGQNSERIAILDIIDTLEVKEVDFEKEISFQWSKFCLNGKDKNSFVKVAKHFFELGMQVSNKAQKGEEI